MSLIERIKQARKQGTPGPWTVNNMVHADGRPMTAEEIGEYVTNSVKMGDPERFLFVSGKHDDGGDCDICHVGNGPRGQANAARISYVPEMEAALLVAEELASSLEYCLEVLPNQDVLLCCSGNECGCHGVSAHQDATHFALEALAKFQEVMK